MGALAVIALRDYQLAAVRAVDRAIVSGERSLLVVAPTGAGKGHVIAHLARRARSLVLVHRAEIVRDLAARCAPASVRTLIAGTYDGPADATVTVALVQSLHAGSVEIPGLELIVTDEAHHAVASTYRALYARHPQAFHVGLTATPSRSDGVGLGDVYDSLYVAARPSELLARGLLAPIRVLAPESASSTLADHAAAAYARHAAGRSAVVFVRGVAEAHALAAAWPEPAAAITGDSAGREDAIARFRRGELRALINVYVLTEGTDLPEADVCVLARGCTSAATYLQIVGRVLRPLPGKHAMLIDLRGVVHTHGLPHDDREWSLAGRTGSARASTLAMRTCRACWYVYRGDVCPECQTAAPTTPPSRVTVRALGEVRTVAREEHGAYLRALVRRFPNPAQARVIFYRKTGAWPTREQMERARA